MSAHRDIRDALRTHVAAWATVNAPDARVVATWSFEELRAGIDPDATEVVGLIVTGVEDNTEQGGARNVDSDLVIVGVFYLIALDDSQDATRNAADDKVDALRNDCLRRIPAVQAGTQNAERERTSLPTPFDHGSLSGSSLWVSMIQTEYSVDVPNVDSIADEPPIGGP